MRIVTLDAVAHRRRMYRPFERGSVFIRVTTQAERLGSRSDQLDAGHIFIDPNFVAGQAAGRDRRMDRFALRLILVALETLGRIDILFKRDRMLFGPCRRRCDQKKKRQQLEEAGESQTEAYFSAHNLANWRRWDHYQPLHVHDPRLCDCGIGAGLAWNCKLLQQLTFHLTPWAAQIDSKPATRCSEWAFCL